MFPAAWPGLEVVTGEVTTWLQPLLKANRVLTARQAHWEHLDGPGEAWGRVGRPAMAQEVLPQGPGCGKRSCPGTQCREGGHAQPEGEAWVQIA